MLKIDKIEGNSKLGFPVFSDQGLKQNYHFKVFQPTFEELKAARERMRPASVSDLQLEEFKQFNAGDIPQKLAQLAVDKKAE